MKCWRCGKEFYSEYWNRTLCDDCLSGKNTTIIIPPLSKPNFVSDNVLLIEEDSIDVEQLEKLGIKFIVYKKGSQKPEIFKPIEFNGE